MAISEPFAPGTRPSLRHALVASVVPRVRRSGELRDAVQERARIEARHRRQDRSLPAAAVPGFSRRFALVEDRSAGFPAWLITPRHTAPRRTVLYLHGGGFVGPLDPFHLRYVTRLAVTLRARIVLPDYPLAPEHTWRDSFEPMVALATRWAAEPTSAAPGSPGMVLMGDSAGGGYALAVAQALRDAGGPQASRLVLHSPWVDLTTSTPETARVSAEDPWLFLGKLQLYAQWWAGSPEDLARPEVSPGLADLGGLPPALVLYGTRDTLAPGCRLLVRRAAEAGWELTAVEEPGLLHVYPLLPLIPEARRAFGQVVQFLR